MNQVIIDGRILPNTEKSPKNYAYYPATGDPANGGKNSFLHFLLSTRKEGAAKGEDGYYPTEIWSIKAFGSTADQIDKYFGPNTAIEFFGTLGEDEPYTDPATGVERRGNKHIKVSRIVYGYGGKPKDEVTAASSAPTRSANNPTPQRRTMARVAAPF